ncbi:MAG: hypothetical protein A2133_05370 [Actinobacteria bacterium RBG_16_64_13]|nr:MAG: hypothetical protein A2133_05370 [Actinobacteria bacterium RBG_16_64_13]
MQRVYLDQNKWIDLLAVTKGKHANGSLADVLRFIAAGVSHGQLSFPLSSTHYMEVSFRRDWASRRDLANLMAVISRFHAIAPRVAILPDEVDCVLRSIFGRPVRVRSPCVFGYGILHSVLCERWPDELERSDLRAQLSQLASFPPGSAEREAVELALLEGPKPEDEPLLPGYNPLATRIHGDLWAKSREDTRATRKAEGWVSGERSERLALAETLAHERVFWERVSAAGVAPEEIFARGRDGLTDLVRQIPMMDVICELGRLRDTADCRPFSANDLADVGFLGPAIVYCDVVVTERQWADHAKRAKLDEKYQTKVIHDLRDLLPLLV